MSDGVARPATRDRRLPAAGRGRSSPGPAGQMRRPERHDARLRRKIDLFRAAANVTHKRYGSRSTELIGS